MSSLELPESWVECTLADIVTINPKNNAAAELTAGFIPMSHAPTKYGGELQFQEKVWGEIKKSYTNFANGDVIFAKVTPCFENGKAAVVENMPNGIGAGSSEFYVLRPLASTISPKLIYALIKSQLFLQEGTENMTGAVGLRRVPKAFVEKFPVALPPPAEQKVIADKLDTLLAQVETIKARLERIPQILKRFRQSVLAAAVSGRLTEDWRDQIGVLVSEWKSLSVGDVATVATGKTPSRKELRYWNAGDIPWLTSASTGAVYTDTAEQFVTVNAVDECSLKVFPPGTLLLAMYGEGKTRGQVTELRLSATCNQACAAITADEQKVLRSYLKLRLLENYEETRKAAAGGAQPNLNLNKVRAIGISVPGKEEQTQIVHRVNQLFTHADRIEQQVQSALERVNNLTQSILAKAFRGELTEQWRKDNPELISGENSAAALLERIKAERAAMQPAKKGRRTKMSS